MHGNRIQLFNVAEDQMIVYRILRNDSNKVLGSIKECLGLARLKVIAMVLTEVLIAFCEGLQADFADRIQSTCQKEWT